MGVCQLFFLFAPVSAPLPPVQGVLELHLEGPSQALFVGQGSVLRVVVEGPEKFLRGGLAQLSPREVEMPLDFTVPWIGERSFELLPREEPASQGIEVVLNGERALLESEQRLALDGSPQLRLTLALEWTPHRSGPWDFPPVAVTYAALASPGNSPLGLVQAGGPATRIEATLEVPSVLPIPEVGRDPGWNGAIGSFTISLASSLPSSLSEGDELTVGISVLGSGTAGRPVRWMGNRRVKTRLLESKPHKGGTLWIYGLVCSGPGPLVLPPFEFHSLDPQSGLFAGQSLELPALRVTGAQRAAEELSTETRWSTSCLALLGIGLGLGLALLLFFRGRRGKSGIRS